MDNRFMLNIIRMDLKEIGINMSRINPISPEILTLNLLQVLYLNIYFFIKYYCYFLKERRSFLFFLGVRKWRGGGREVICNN